MENFENSENVEIVEDLENFPVKDRSKAAIRRKKTFAKGNSRFYKVYSSGFTPFPDEEHIIIGMLRKTNVIKVSHEKDATHFGTNPSTVRRKLSANEKIAEYSMEAV